MTDMAVQTLPKDELENLQGDLLRHQLEYVLAASPFYRRKFKDLSSVGRIRSLEDFSRLPVTYKDELRQSQIDSPPLGDVACVPPARPVRISSTSGTTGRPFYYAVTPSDKEAIWQSWVNCFSAAEIVENDLVMYGFAMGGPYGALYGAEALEWARIPTIPIGSSESSERFKRLLTDLRPSVLTCVTNFPSRLAARIKEDGSMPADLGVRCLLLGGEPVGPHREAIENEWQATTIEMMGMGEFGMVWAECRAQRGMHYVSKDLTLVEFVDPHSLELVDPEPGATAELVYTALRREATPLVRYRTRDIVEVSASDCPCGRTGPLVRCIGRSDDMIKVRGVNIFPSAIESLISEAGAPMTGDFRVLLPNGERKFSTPLKLLLGIEDASADALDLDVLDSRISNYLRDHLGVRVEVQFVSRGTFSEALRGGLDRRDYFLEEKLN